MGQFLSAGAVAMNLCIAANALGYATNWISNWYAEDAPARAFLGLAPHERVAGFVHIGTAENKMPERPRADMEKDRFGLFRPVGRIEEACVKRADLYGKDDVL